MNANADEATTMASPLVKADPNGPALFVTADGFIAIKAGTQFGGRAFAEDAALLAPDGGFVAGSDYVVIVPADAAPTVAALTSPTLPAGALGGFHFAPGGNAVARAGGDTLPAINPCSLWDLNFRPVCADPRGMALIDPAGLPALGFSVPKFWCDIYLTGADHLTNGTSRFGVTIADGESLPKNPAGKRFKKFDYATAKAVIAHHGKALLSYAEFVSAAYGVTEATSVNEDPEKTGLDAPRTSRFGLMQATGNLWQWGHDGDPDERRASFFGGYWRGGGFAGSRRASLGTWPGNSDGSVGARGRCDHLQPE